MRAIVTGGAGFIGSHVVEALLARGDEVTVVDDLSNGKRENLPEGVRLVERDVREGVGDVFGEARPEVCFHLGAQVDVRVSVDRPTHDASVNVLGTIEVLEAARAHDTQVVFSSTGGAIYGECDGPAPETAERRPLAPYGVSKLAGEEYLAAYNRLYGTRHVSLRYGNVYGPRQDPHGEAGVVAIFLGKLAAGRGAADLRRRLADARLRLRRRRRAGDAGRGRAGRRRLQRRHRDGDVGGRALRSFAGAAAGSTLDAEQAPARLGELQRSVLDVSLASADARLAAGSAARTRACASPGSRSRASRRAASGGESDDPPWSTPFRIQARPAPIVITPGARSPS